MPGGVVMAGCGLFGKTSSRRDFIAINVPRAFLAVWEPWLQQGLARSRADLGEAWLTLFLTSPIWSFRLGAALCGVEIVGAMMPSMDGAGRCYPLTLIACAEDGHAFVPDGVAATQWFAAVEAYLLSTLDPARSYEAVLADLDHLPRPALTPAAATRDRDSQWWTGGGTGREPDELEAEGFPEPAALTRMIDRRISAEAPGGNGSAS